MLDLAENPILNGYFDASTDTTTLTAAGKIAATWQLADLGTGGAGSTSIQAFTFGQTDVPDATNFLRHAQTTGGTVTQPRVSHLIESALTMADKIVTVSGYYRANAALTVQLRQKFGTGGSPSADVTTTAGTLPVTTDSAGVVQWRSFSLSVRVPGVLIKTFGSTAGTDYLAVEFLGPLSTVFQFDLANVRMVRGGQRDVSVRRPASYERRHVRRYYGTYAIKGVGAISWASFPLSMIATPTVTGDVGTVANPTVDGCSVNHTAGVAVALTADARIAI